MSDRLPFTAKEEEALWADRLALAIRRIGLEAEHDRVVRKAREGAEILAHFHGHREDALLTLELSQLHGLVSPAEVAEATAKLLGSTLAIELLETGLAELESVHLAIHGELEFVELLVAEHDAALDAIEQAPDAPFAEQPTAPHQARAATA